MNFMNIAALLTICALTGCSANTEPVPIAVPPAPKECVFDCAKDAIVEPQIVVTRTDEKRKGLYVYQVVLQAPGYGEMIEMISGRPWKQDSKEEAIADIGAPLPKGEYQITPIVTTAPRLKFGGIFIAFEPLFQTARYDLGFHHDPEFATGGKELGTMGCLATMTEADRNKLINFIRTYQPTQLTVN